MLLAAAALACGGDDEAPSSNSNGGSDRPRPQSGGGSPLSAECDPLSPVMLDNPTEVANEDELRAAVAAGGHVLVTADITATAPFDVGADTVLDGGGHTISGGDDTHLFVGSRVDFTVQNATLADANNQVSDDEHFARRSGAAISMSGGGGDQPDKIGSLTAIDVVFENNRAKPSGPGDIRGGAVYLFAMPDSTFSGCTFRDNTASSGGAIGGLGSSFSVINSQFIGNSTNSPSNDGGFDGTGGAISLDGLSQNGKTAHLRICGSEFRANTARATGGALYLVAHWYQGNEVVIDRSVFADNLTTANDEGQGGAIFLMDDDSHEQPADPVASRASVTSSLFVGNSTWSGGGGIWYWTQDGSLELTNVTFADNVAVPENDTSMGGAVAISRGPANLVNCTFANNYARFHGGAVQMGSNAEVTLENSLFYNNRSDRDGGYANFHTNRPADIDAGGNIQWLDPDLEIDSSSNAPVSENVTVADPLLGELGDNGGPTWTMPLGAGSPAIDAGVAEGAPDHDQRGEPRTGAPDVGAFEAD